MEQLITAANALQNTPKTMLTNAISGMSHTQLSGLFDPLETALKLIEKLQAEVEREISYQEWDGAA